MTDEPEVPLTGGDMTAVVRVGDTVRRPAGPWTPSVHALLRHLRAAGSRKSPRPPQSPLTGPIDGDLRRWHRPLHGHLGRPCVG